MLDSDALAMQACVPSQAGLAVTVPVLVRMYVCSIAAVIAALAVARAVAVAALAAAPGSGQQSASTIHHHWQPRIKPRD